MNRTLYFYMCLAGMLSVSGVVAAEGLIAIPQGNFSCNVKVKTHSAAEPDPSNPELRYAPVLKSVAITQVDGIRRDISRWSNGSISQLWNIVEKKVSLMESNTAGKDVYVLRGWLRKNTGPALLRLDAESISWITEAALTKKLAEGSGPLHYQATVVISEPGEVPVVTTLYQAWIDRETLLPKMFDDGNATYVLNFSAAPAAPLAMPDNIRAELSRWLAASAPRPHL